MKSFDTELKKYAEKIRLRAIERRELRERILAYMEYHPLPKRQKRTIESAGIISQPFWMVRINALSVRIATGVFALLLVVVVLLMAERALPGDVLYLVKTQINEEIRAKFVDSPYEKVAYETTLIERRIAEARLLASEGKLTEKVEAKIAETVKGHANAAQNGIDELRTQNADDAAIAEISFDSALQIQSAVLETQAGASEKSSTANLRDVVNTVREEAVAKRGTTTPSYEGLSARVERETTRAYELFGVITKTATPNEVRDIERRLSDIDRKIVSAREKHELADGGASVDLVSALSLTQKLIVFMTDINVRATVDLESIVPVEFTLDERIASVKESVEGIMEMLELVATRTPLITDESVLLKVALGVEGVRSEVAYATSSIASSSIDAALIGDVEARIREAMAVATDLDLLTKLMVPQEEAEVPQPFVDPEVEGLPTEEATSTSKLNEENAASTTESASETTQPFAVFGQA